MKDILLATYVREDTYKGHSKINHYHIPCELRCYRVDNSAEREKGFMINGKPCHDYYDILEVNYKGDVIYRHHYTDRETANKAFANLVRNSYSPFVKVE